MDVREAGGIGHELQRVARRRRARPENAQVVKENVDPRERFGDAHDGWHLRRHHGQAGDQTPGLCLRQEFPTLGRSQPGAVFVFGEIVGKAAETALSGTQTGPRLLKTVAVRAAARRRTSAAGSGLSHAKACAGRQVGSRKFARRSDPRSGLVAECPSPAVAFASPMEAVESNDTENDRRGCR